MGGGKKGNCGGMQKCPRCWGQSLCNPLGVLPRGSREPGHFCLPSFT